MKLKKFLTLSIVAMLIIASVISVNAVEYTDSSTVMCGFEVQGSVTAYPASANGHTYCEHAAAGKSAKTYFAYYNKSNQVKYTEGGDENYDYTVQTGLVAVTEAVPSSSLNGYAGAKTLSKVKLPAPYAHYVWESDETDTPLRLGYYVNHN